MRLSKVCLVWSLLLLLPAIANAQATITGVVRDTSGAVLPGVTVEAASPALIEKVRTAVTGSDGQYRIVDLRPGAYTVTFTLPGFATVRRDGVELTGTFTANVSADLRVGTVEETVTVTGQAPLVDVQTATRQQVIEKEAIDNLPTSRLFSSLAVLVPGVTAIGAAGGGGSQDVGGALGDIQQTLSIHGSRAQDTRITLNGMSVSTLQAGGQAPGMQSLNMAAMQEMTVDTAGVNAEQPTGGPRISLVPRDGGNNFTSSFFTSFANGATQGSNFTQRLKDRGLRTPDEMKEVWEVTPSVGGPLQRDRVWFFWAGRYYVANTFAAGMFANRNAYKPNEWTYVPDESQPAHNDSTWKSSGLRLTWQLTPRNKLAFNWDQHYRCSCPFFVSATRAPEAAADRRSPTQRLLNAQYTSPVSNRVLLEAAMMHRTERWGNMHLSPVGSLDDPASLAAAPQMISVTEQSSGLVYRGFSTYNNTWVPNYALRATLSYITGAHEFKTGLNDYFGHLDQRTYNFQPLAYRFNNGIPNQLTMFDTPFASKSDQDHDFGAFVQDKWRINRLTLAGGLRFDMFNTSFPDQSVGGSLLNPTRNYTFEGASNLAWRDITYRSSITYDLFGNGKTAIRSSLNKYVRGQGLNALGSTPNPVNRLVTQTARSWTDTNRNYVPECDLLNPNQNAECGPMVNRNFGTLVPATNYDPDLLTGWGHRDFNWEFSAGVQTEILPRVALDVGYYRRWFGNFTVTDNVLVQPTDFTPFNIPAPADSRLPNGGGYQVSGLLDLNPNKVGQVSDLVTLSSKYGDQIERWNGVDVTLTTRLAGGLTLSGGTSTGRTTTDNCEIRAKLPEMAPLNPYCDVDGAVLTQVKSLAMYTIPRARVLVSATFQSLPGPEILATYNATNAVVAPSLGRTLSGGAANAPVSLVSPMTHYGERLNQLDLRVGKMLRFNRVRSTISLDIYNAMNVDTILVQNNNFATWQAPITIVQPRFLKFTAQFDF